VDVRARTHRVAGARARRYRASVPVASAALLALLAASGGAAPEPSLAALVAGSAGADGLAPREPDGRTGVWLAALRLGPPPAPAAPVPAPPRAAHPVISLLPVASWASPMGSALVRRRSSRRETAPPVCSGDVCEPIVAVPGFEPSYSIRGKRTELTLKLLQRFPIEPFATVIWWLGAAGLRFDWTPPQLRPGDFPPGYTGLGEMQVELRWKIDARGVPIFPRRYP
jgi:hypothetical protein